MREALVVARPDHRQVVRSLRCMRKEIRYPEPRLAVLLECPLRSENDRVAKLAVLEILVSEAVRRMLAVKLVQQRLGVVRIDLARAALHEKRDHAFGGGREMRGFRSQRARGFSSRTRTVEEIDCG